MNTYECTIPIATLIELFCANKFFFRLATLKIFIKAVCMTDLSQNAKNSADNRLLFVAISKKLSSHDDWKK